MNWRYALPFLFVPILYGIIKSIAEWVMNRRRGKLHSNSNR